MQNYIAWLRKIGNSFSLKMYKNRSDPFLPWLVAGLCGAGCWNSGLDQGSSRLWALCLVCDNWLEPVASPVSHIPASSHAASSLLSLLTCYFVQLCVKALPFPKCFQTSSTTLTITSLAISLKSLVLGGLCDNFHLLWPFFLLGSICMCAGGMGGGR